MIVLDAKDHIYSQEIANQIRCVSKKFIVSNSYNYKNLKSQLKKADKLSTDYCVIIGNEESEQNTCQLKNMSTGQQENIHFDKLTDYIKDKIL